METSSEEEASSTSSSTEMVAETPVEPEEERSREFKGTVSSLGITGSAEQPLLILCCQQPKKPLQFMLTRLDCWSSPLLSPFYEHDVWLCEVPEAPATYVMREWRAARFRISEQVRDEQKYAEQVRDLLRHSFYLMMAPPSTSVSEVPPWQSQCLDWQSRRWPQASQFLSDFSLGEWLGKELSPSAYWTQFCSRFAGTLKPLIQSAGLGCKTAVAHNTHHLRQQLQAWKDARHVAGYLQYRLCDMSLCHRMHARGLTEVPQAILDADRLGDLDLLCTGGGEYKDLDALLGRTLADGRLTHVVEHLQLDVAQLTRATLIPWLKQQCTSRASATQSTVYPLRLDNLHYLTSRLLLGRDAATSDAVGGLDLTLASETGPSATESSETTSAAAGRLCAHKIHVALYASLCGAAGWYRVDSLEGTRVSDTHAHLAYLCIRPAQLDAERALMAEVAGTGGALRHLCCTVDESPLEWDAAQWRNDFFALEPCIRDLYQTRVHALLFPPYELAAGGSTPLDLKAMLEVVSLDRLTSLVVLPPRVDVSRRRLSLALPTRLPRMLCCTESLPSHLADEEDYFNVAVVVAVDCHLFSADALTALFSWLRVRRVPRLLMLGALDSNPLHCAGQPWLDALYWATGTTSGYQPAVTLRHHQLNDWLDSLIDAGACRLHACRPFQLQDKLIELLRRTRRPSVLHLYCLERSTVNSGGGRTTAAAKKTPSPLVSLLEENLTPKFRGNNTVRIECVTLAQLPLLPLTSQAERGEGHFFFVCGRDAAQLERNEWNHLLLESLDVSLIFLAQSGDEPGDDGIVHWLKQSRAAHHRYANVRYTLSHLQRSGISAEIDYSV